MMPLLYSFIIFALLAGINAEIKCKTDMANSTQSPMGSNITVSCNSNGVQIHDVVVSRPGSSKGTVLSTYDGKDPKVRLELISQSNHLWVFKIYKIKVEDIGIWEIKIKSWSYFSITTYIRLLEIVYFPPSNEQRIHEEPATGSIGKLQSQLN